MSILSEDKDILGENAYIGMERIYQIKYETSTCRFEINRSEKSIENKDNIYVQHIFHSNESL